MKILVLIKRVPDPYSRLRLTPEGKLDTGTVKWVINPFDEIALEEAVRIRERGVQADIVAVSCGPSQAEEQLRAALALGADRALLVQDEEEQDSRIVAHLLAATAAREAPDLILMGKQATDDDCSQVAGWLAALLGWPLASYASAVEMNAEQKTVRVTREVDTGRETVMAPLPAIISADLRLNQPRYVALPAIIRARSKPLEKIAAALLGPRPLLQLRTLSFQAPPARRAGRKMGSVDELIRALRDEAHVI